MKYLSPSEIELWELAKKATCRMPNVSLDDDFEQERDAITEWHKTQRGFRAALTPPSVASLLKTLEKTREALVRCRDEAYRLGDDGYALRLMFWEPDVRSLLSGFSGDAPSEEE